MATGPRLSINCPHCGDKARVRTSRGETPLVREASLQCQNLECGHTFVAKLEITHTIAPSHRPNPEIVLPVTPVNLRRSIATSSHLLSPENDNRGLAVPQLPPASAAASAR